MKERNWPQKGNFKLPKNEEVEKALETYARVVRDIKPPEQRPEFRIKPEDRLRKIF